MKGKIDLNEYQRYVDYENSINVLNEGFFKACGKLIKKLMGKLFACKNYKQLDRRLTKLQDIIRYGADKNGDALHTDADDTVEAIKDTAPENGTDDGNETAESVLMPFFKTMNEETMPSRSRNGENIPARTRVKQDGIPANPAHDTLDESGADSYGSNEDVNMNVPSFRVVCVEMLNGLKAEWSNVNDTIRKNADGKDLKTYLDAASSGIKEGTPIPYATQQKLFIIATDFIRKYSSGTIQPPEVKKGEMVGQKDVDKWRNLIGNERGGKDNSFESVRKAMEKVIEIYDGEFKETLTLIENELKASDDGNVKNQKSIIEHKRNLSAKWELIKTKCESFIPTAIEKFFINDDIYENVLSNVEKILDVLYSNDKLYSSYSESVCAQFNEYMQDEDNRDEIQNSENLFNKLVALDENTKNNYPLLKGINGSNIKNIKETFLGKWNEPKFSKNAVSCKNIASLYETFKKFVESKELSLYMLCIIHNRRRNDASISKIADYQELLKIISQLPTS